MLSSNNKWTIIYISLTVCLCLSLTLATQDALEMQIDASKRSKRIEMQDEDARQSFWDGIALESSDAVASGLVA